MPRKRDYIRLPEKLAATLACLLSQEVRDDLRSRKVPAPEVLSLFHFDHIILHSFGGSDEWWNLDPKLVKPHQEKSKIDTKIAAKAKRIDKKWIPFKEAILAGRKPPKRISRWPKRKFRQWQPLKSPATSKPRSPLRTPTTGRATSSNWRTTR